MHVFGIDGALKTSDIRHPQSTFQEQWRSNAAAKRLQRAGGRRARLSSMSSMSPVVSKMFLLKFFFGFW